MRLRSRERILQDRSNPVRVIDASIFPVVPCANTNFPVLMSAEKIAAAMQ
jgi:choline dehydrogenase-like flavoprotein